MRELLRERIKRKLPNNLDSSSTFLDEGKKIASGLKIGKTLFFKENNVSSEREYKQKQMANGEIMFHMQYGLTDFEKSAKGLKYIYEESLKRGQKIDRFGICLERRMGLPEELRSKIPRETGLELKHKSEWKDIGQIVPVQPHFGDNMIGSPASIENTINAVEAGITTIGNLSQYFSYEYPLWNNKLKRTENTVTSLGMMAALRDKGMMVHSNIDDGISSQFQDTCSLIGWAMMEYYIAEKLTGAKLTHCFGNLVDEPELRMAIVLALKEIHEGELIGSMVNGNTISATKDLDRNFAPVANYVLFDILLQMEHPTGHAVGPLPITELVRIPSPDEIIQIQVFGEQLKKEARKVRNSGILNFSNVYKLRDELLVSGRKFFENLMDFLSDIIDIKDPIQVMLALKDVNPLALEKCFAVGKKNEDSVTGLTPNIPRKMYLQMNEMIENGIKEINLNESQKKNTTDKKVFVASTDVHEFGKMYVGRLIQSTGIEVIDLGPSVNAEDVIQHYNENAVDAFVVSTYNGCALTYAKQLLELMEEESIKIPVFMGGRLNEDTGEDLPVDVEEDLNRLGVKTHEDVVELIEDFLNI